MKIKEIMKKEVLSLKPKDKIKEAVLFLFKNRISGLPVINEKGEAVGMFTEKEFLKQILPSYIDKLGTFVYEDNPKYIKKRIQDLAEFRVEQLMRKEVEVVNENTALCEVARLMLTQKIRRIVVVNEEKRVIGIVSREDVVRAYAKEAGWIEE